MAPIIKSPMSLTKDEVSDLRSLISRVNQALIEREKAILAHEHASQKLEVFLLNQQTQKSKDYNGPG